MNHPMHRVLPAITADWAAGRAHPPGEGFEEVPPLHRRMWSEWLLRRLAAAGGIALVCAVAFAIGRAVSAAVMP